ncbi:MAG: pseudouridine synthase [Gammaproteobacteria bacterium]
MAERLQKWLAGQGLGSRREIERWIDAGRIEVDGVKAELGLKVTGEENIRIDGKALRKHKSEEPQKSRVLIYNKPSGEICSRSDPDGRRTIFQSLPKVISARWITVGRLDYQTTGLLLVTTDGELANKLMHPSSELKREYVVRALGELSDDQQKRLLKGIRLDDGPAKFDSLVHTEGEGANKSYRVVVSEGRNRIIRRMFEAVGCRVNRLMRVSYGNISLPRKLRPGKYQELSDHQVAQLIGSVQG